MSTTPVLQASGDLPALDISDNSHEGTDERRRDRQIALLLLVGSLATYVAITPGMFSAYDAQSMFAVTKNLVDHASLRTTGLDDPFHASTPYSPYGIGVSLLAVVPYALSKVVGHMMLLASMINPVLTAVAVVMVYLIARALKWRPMHGVVAAIGFGLFTMALQSTTELFSEPGITLCIVVLVYGIVRWGQGWRWAPLVVGLSAAWAVQLRSDSLLTVWIGLLALPLFLPWSALWNRRSVLLAGVPMLVSVVGLCAYNELRYSKLFIGAYGPGGGFTTPLFTGLHGDLFLPGKSIFLFNPLVLLGVVGLGFLLFRDRPVGVLFLLLIVPRLLFFSTWSSWGGGWCWGPRFLSPTIPLLILAAVELLRVWDRRSYWGITVRALAVVLAVVTIPINYLSVRVQYEQWLYDLESPSTLAKLGMHSLTPWQQAQDYYSQFSTGPIWGDVTLLHHRLAPMAFDWWAHGRAYVGFFFLAVGAAALVVAVLMARDRPRVVPTG